MAYLLLFAIAQAVTQPAAAPLPRDWASLPQMALDRRARPAPEDTSAIIDLARRQPECRASVGPLAGTSASDEMNGVRVDIAVLINPDGSFRSIVARPGPCDAIRNYTRSIVNTRFRGHVTAPAGPGPAWYTTTLTFFGRP
jgi:hypothetical protein